VHVLVYSYFAPLESHLSGGSQLVLRTLLERLPAHGLTIAVACPPAEEPLLDAGPAVHVEPVLEEPAEAPLTPAQRLHNLRVLAALVRDCDVVLSVDRTFPLPTRRPLVLLLDNFSYGTEVDSVFGLDWDSMIVPSEYLRAEVEAVAGGRFWTGGRRPIEVIAPAVDVEHFRPRDASGLRQALGLAEDDECLLFPHRPDPDKGFSAALRLVAELRVRGRRHRLLVPEPPLSTRAVRRRESAFVRGIRARARPLGDSVVFHPWLSYDEMPALLTLGVRTLALGSFPESFGLSALQSIACGTPVLATPVGARPSVLPPGHGLTLLPRRCNATTVADRVLAPPDPEATRRGREAIRRRYGPDRLAERVAAHLGRARKSRARFVVRPAARASSRERL
jgi:glycosyltransferase involved in cell wall biosynthesis